MTIKTAIGIAAGFALLLMGFAAFAEEVPAPSLTGRVDLNYVSKYVWRGSVLNPDAAIQPSITFTFDNGASYNLWMSGNLTDGSAGVKNRVVEHDHTFTVPFTLGKMSMSTGAIYYSFPTTTYPDTMEIFVTATAPCLFSPTLSINHDFKVVHGTYFALSGSYALPECISKIPVSVTGKVGFGSASYIKTAYPGGIDKDGMLDCVVGASASIPVGKLYTITPSVSYSTIVNSDVKDGIKASSSPYDVNNFVAGLTMSATF